MSYSFARNSPEARARPTSPPVASSRPGTSSSGIVRTMNRNEKQVDGRDRGAGGDGAGEFHAEKIILQPAAFPNVELVTLARPLPESAPARRARWRTTNGANLGAPWRQADDDVHPVRVVRFAEIRLGEPRRPGRVRVVDADDLERRRERAQQPPQLDVRGVADSKACGTSVDVWRRDRESTRRPRPTSKPQHSRGCASRARSTSRCLSARGRSTGRWLTCAVPADREQIERLRIRQRLAVPDRAAVNHVAHGQLDDLAALRARDVGDLDDPGGHVARRRVGTNLGADPLAQRVVERRPGASRTNSTIRSSPSHCLPDGQALDALSGNCSTCR